MNPDDIFKVPLEQVQKQSETWLSANLWFLTLIFLLIVFYIALMLVRRSFRRASCLKFSFQKAVLLVSLPKESPGNDKEARKSIKETLLPTENLFDNIGGLKAQKGWRAWFFGRSDSFSFEIVSDKKGIISFYVVVPRTLQQFFEQQIHAQYPAANIEEVEDYNVFLPQNYVISAFFRLKKLSMFPIKTYLKMETDPLSAIINSLNKIAPDDSAIIQFVARSARPKWRKFGSKVASEMQQGKNLNQAMSSVKTGMAKVLFELGGFISPKAKKPEQAGQKISHQLSPFEQEAVKAIEEKANKAGLDVNIRVVVSSRVKERAETYLNNIVNAFAQYTGYEYGNGFKIFKSGNAKTVRNFIYRIFDEKRSFVLNAEEMTSVFHFPLPTTEAPNIRWLIAKKAPAPVDVPAEGLILGYNIYRREKKEIRIKDADRRRHIYAIGKTGVGKSVLIANMAIQDVKNNQGVCVIDPHGDLIEAILEHVPKERAEDVIYFDPADMSRPMGLNLLEYDPKYPEQKTFLINEMINIMDKLYDLRQTGGPMFEQYLRNALLLIMEHPQSGSTLMEVSKVLADPSFRAFKLSHCANQVVRDFWIKEAEKAGGEGALSNITPYITSKLNQFVANDIMRPIIGQQQSAFNFRKIMDEQKILLINLSKGKIGDLNSYLLGLILVGKILIASLSRTDMPEEERKDFYLYIDEFQNFITDSVSTILAEARKYRLCLMVAHQYIGQLVKNGQDASIRDAIFGTVGTIICFKVGVEDAEFLAKEFEPVFSPYDLVNVEKFNAYIKLLVDNQSLRPFNLQPVPPQRGNKEIAQIVRELSHLKYGRNKAEVEKEISERGRIGISGNQVLENRVNG